MKRQYFIILAIIFLLNGCSTTRSSFDSELPDKSFIYLAGDEQIRELIHTAMAQEFGGNITNVSIDSTIGYKATVEVLLDFHDIAIYGRPVQGVDSKGESHDGFILEVIDAGTMLVSQKMRAKKLYRRITEQADSTFDKIRVEYVKSRFAKDKTSERRNNL